jgi:predicted RNA binding protein YcfA (HicA-like mRNA interferase family)
MSRWPAAKASRVFARLTGIGWTVKRQSGGFPDFVFAFHDGDEIGPRMLARIAKRTGLTTDDL